MNARRLLLLLAAAKTIAGAGAAEGDAPLRYEEPRVLKATIYPKDSDRSRPLYSFQRTVTREGSRLNVLREFNYPDGKPAARERVVYEGNQLTSFELEELQLGAHGRASLQPASGQTARGTIRFQYTQKKTRTESEPLRPDTLIADMVGPFLADHWQTLMRGQQIACRYLVVPRKETIGFEFVKIRQESRRGKEVVIVKMEPSSALISSLVDPLFFVIEKEGRHRVLEYTGRTTPKLRQGNKWKDLDAVTVFEWD